VAHTGLRHARWCGDRHRNPVQPFPTSALEKLPGRWPEKKPKTLLAQFMSATIQQRPTYDERREQQFADGAQPIPPKLRKFSTGTRKYRSNVKIAFVECKGNLFVESDEGEVVQIKKGTATRFSNQEKAEAAAREYSLDRGYACEAFMCEACSFEATRHGQPYRKDIWHVRGNNLTQVDGARKKSTPPESNRYNFPMAVRLTKLEFYNHPFTCPYCHTEVAFTSVMQTLLGARRTCPACTQEMLIEVGKAVKLPGDRQGKRPKRAQ
jgi:hypothetical protein